jgi:hypothetical protein
MLLLPCKLLYLTIAVGEYAQPHLVKRTYNISVCPALLLYHDSDEDDVVRVGNVANG